MNLFFKSAFIIISILGLIILYGIYDKSPRYQMATSTDGYVRVINVKTGQIYFYIPNDGYIYFNNGIKVTIKKLP
jgi:hypothetical protein